MQPEAGTQIHCRATDFRWQLQRVEFRGAAGQRDVCITDHPCIDRTQVIGVVIAYRFNHWSAKTQ
jgi:uncharacterized protein with HEPN domain